MRGTAKELLGVAWTSKGAAKKCAGKQRNGSAWQSKAGARNRVGKLRIAWKKQRKTAETPSSGGVFVCEPYNYTKKHILEVTVYI